MTFVCICASCLTNFEPVLCSILQISTVSVTQTTNDQLPVKHVLRELGADLFEY